MMMRRRRGEKHMPYYELLDAMSQAAVCPLCVRETASLERYFDAVLSEMVNDPGVRSELTRSHGYCHRHLHMLLERRSGLGTAILLEDAVTAFGDALADLPPTAPRRTVERSRREWSDHNGCPACRIQFQSRERNVSVLLEHLSLIHISEPTRPY